MRKSISTIIVLGAMISTMAGFDAANAQTMNFKSVDAYGNVSGYTEYHRPLVQPAPAYRAPAQIWWVQYVVCIDGYERVEIMPYEHGRHFYETCPAPVESWSDAALAPEISPFPRRNPIRARQAHTVSTARATSSNLSALALENSVIGASAAAVSISIGATAPPRQDHQDRQRAIQPAVTWKASDAAAKHAAKRFLIRAIPIVGTAVLLYDLAGLVE